MAWWVYSYEYRDRKDDYPERTFRFIELRDDRRPICAKAIFHSDVILGPFANRETAEIEWEAELSERCQICFRPLGEYYGTTDHRYPYLCRKCADSAEGS